MEKKAIINVIPVEIHSLIWVIWRDTSRQSMIAKKNTKLVILVGNPSLPQEIWDFTLIQFIKFRKIICVNFVKNRFRNQVHWKSVSKLFTIMTYTANFFQQNKYWTSTSTLLIRITKDTTKIDLCVHLDANENTFLRWSYMSMK